MLTSLATLACLTTLGHPLFIDRVSIKCTPATATAVNADDIDAIPPLSIEAFLDGKTIPVPGIVNNYPRVDMTRGTNQQTAPQLLNRWSDMVGRDYGPNGDPNGIVNLLLSLRHSNVGFYGQNMNAMSFEPAIGINLATPVDLELGPGTVFIPDRPGFQDMVLTSTIRTMFRYDLRASTQPTFTQDSIKGQTICADMSLKEPAPEVRYWFFPPKDPNIAKIADITAKAQHKGPWDQARMWIYTDHASLDQINHKLLPRLIPGYYTRCLRDLMDIKAMDKDLLKNKDVWSPELLFAPCGDEDAATKYFAHMIETFPKETRTALEKGFNDQVNALWTSAGADLKAEHLGFMMRDLLGCNNTDVQTGILAFLEKRVPAELRDHLKAMTGFDKVTELAESSTKGVADAAKKVMKAYGM